MPPREPGWRAVQAPVRKRRGLLRGLLSLPLTPVWIVGRLFRVPILEHRLRIEEGRTAAARGECEHVRRVANGLAKELTEARGERDDARRVAEAVIAERDTERARAENVIADRESVIVDRDRICAELAAARRCADAQAAEVERAQGRADAAERGHALLVAQRDAVAKERDAARGQCARLITRFEAALHYLPLLAENAAGLRWLRGEMDHEPRAMHCDDAGGDS